MVRAVTVDDVTAVVHFATLFGHVGWEAGLLVGRLGVKQRDHVVHVAAMPADPQRPDAKPSNLTDVAGIRRDIEALRDNWFAIHAEQVRRTLPGGLDVVGVYVFCPSAVDATNKLRALATAACRDDPAVQLDQWLENSPVRERYIVQVCSDAKKIACRTVDIADPRASPKPTTWTEGRFVAKWISVSAAISTALDCAVPITAKQPSLFTALLASAQPLLTGLRQSIVLIDGRSSLDDPSLPLSAQTGGKGGKKNTADKPVLSARVLMPATASLAQSAGAPLLHVALAGAMHLVAVMPADVTLGEAQMALRVDAMRSVASRLAILAENIEDEREDESALPSNQLLVEACRVKRSLPTRVLNRSVHPLVFCDYTFDRDGLEDCRGNFKQVLGIAAETADFATHEAYSTSQPKTSTQALPPAPPTQHQQQKPQQQPTATPKPPAEQQQQQQSLLIGAVIVLLLSVVVILLLK